MASSPVFAGSIIDGHGSLSAANTNRDGTGTIVTVQTAGASGCIIRQLEIKATGDPADCNIVLYRYDGTNTIPYAREIRLGNAAAGSATVSSFQLVVPVNIKIGPNNQLRASITAAPTTGVVNVMVTDGQNL